MLKSRKFLSYANVMSTFAVFLALTGATAFAATQLSKNSVASKHLKKNAVTSAKIKKNAVTNAKIKKSAVTGSKIKDGTITGNKLALTTLAAVPEAKSLSGHQRTGLVRVAATDGADQTAARAAAPETALLTSGPFTVYAKCYSYSTRIYGEVYIKTTEGGAIFDSDYDDARGNPFLEPSTAEDDRMLMYDYRSDDNSAGFYGVHSSEFLAISASGTVMRGDTSVAIKRGTLPGGQGVYGDGNVCLFTGESTQLNQ